MFCESCWVHFGTQDNHKHAQSTDLDEQLWFKKNPKEKYCLITKKSVGGFFSGKKTTVGGVSDFDL